MSVADYVLVTASRNEEKLIVKTIESVAAQTLLPAKWVIISDGSVDQTDEIIRHYAKRHTFIEYYRRETEEVRNFASKVRAIQQAESRLRGVSYDFIGNQDADCSFGQDYYEKVLRMFCANHKLGIAGGAYHEQIRGKWTRVRSDTDWSVTGGIQMFRRDCYKNIGGYLPLEHGGVDVAAEIMARMNGWEVRADPDLIVFHHRRMGSAERSIFNARFREGQMEYLVGYLPMFELLKSIYRMTDRPYLFGSAVKLAGYLSLWIGNSGTCLSDEIVEFLRREQRRRIVARCKVWKIARQP